MNASKQWPRLQILKSNCKGTGGALNLVLHPAHDLESGRITATLARQTAIANPNAEPPTYAKFDWDDAVGVDLGFDDLTKIIQVFRGECETIDDGKGIYRRMPDGYMIANLLHVIVPMSGYILKISRSRIAPSDIDTRQIFLAPNEALGICAAIEASMGLVCFGVPTPSGENEC